MDIQQLSISEGEDLCIPGEKIILPDERMVPLQQTREEAHFPLDLVRKETNKSKEDNGKIVARTTSEFLSLTFPPKDPMIPGLLHKRDQVCFTGRRRHGKTEFLIQLALHGARGAEYIGFSIPSPFRSLLILAEDDSGEVQDKLRRYFGEDQPPEGVALITRDDFLDADIPIDAADINFRDSIEKAIQEKKPDLVSFDNLAHLINAKYGDTPIVHDLMRWTYHLCKTYNIAVIFAAHPRKADQASPPVLEGNLENFAEETMGTSHFINSTGSLWAIQYNESTDRSLFAGGRQRGTPRTSYEVPLLMEDYHFVVDVEAQRDYAAALTTEARRSAWNALPDEFTFKEGSQACKAHLASSNSFTAFLNVCCKRRMLKKEGKTYVKVRENN